MNKRSSSGDLERRLIYFPIVHTQADMGRFGESIDRVTLQKFGRKVWRRKANLIDKMWTEIEVVIDGLALSYERVRLYQDGLPACGREAEIVKELAKAGSRNHKLLLSLMERGATIMGTESSELLIQEYELFKQILGARNTLKGTRMDVRQKTLSDSLLKGRDQHIADRINKTLRSGETGILFLGMLHSVENKLDNDIRVVYPINPPIEHGGK